MNQGEPKLNRVYVFTTVNCHFIEWFELSTNHTVLHPRKMFNCIASSYPITATGKAIVNRFRSTTTHFIFSFYSNFLGKYRICRWYMRQKKLIRIYFLLELKRKHQTRKTNHRGWIPLYPNGIKIYFLNGHVYGCVCQPTFTHIFVLCRYALFQSSNISHFYCVIWPHSACDNSSNSFVDDTKLYSLSLFPLCPCCWSLALLTVLMLVLRNIWRSHIAYNCQFCFFLSHVIPSQLTTPWYIVNLILASTIISSYLVRRFHICGNVLQW